MKGSSGHCHVRRLMSLPETATRVKHVVETSVKHGTDLGDQGPGLNSIIREITNCLWHLGRYMLRSDGIALCGCGRSPRHQYGAGNPKSCTTRHALTAVHRWQITEVKAILGMQYGYNGPIPETHVRARPGTSDTSDTSVPQGAKIQISFLRYSVTLETLKVS